jgi:transcriptional regulator with PAS, ATPase and Fis domain
MGTIALMTLILAAVTTERRQSAEALGESSARLQAIVDTAIDGIVTMDDQCLITSFNPGAQQIFGYQSERSYRSQCESAHAGTPSTRPRLLHLEISCVPASARSSASAGGLWAAQKRCDFSDGVKR